MGRADSPNWCPTLRPTEAEFRRPFTEFVSGVFRQDPGLPMFKVVPPPAWRPRRGNFPDLKSVRIDTPIRQHAFGQKGAYRCMFVEHKPLQVSDFRDITISEADRITGHKGQSGSAAASGVVNHTQRRLESRRALHDGEDIMERSFWSSVTLNPPLYGADTPHSFFDAHLSYGWNLRNLGDLLKTKPVPEIPGVTTPMTYFGMWRSFFGWHKEDADLYSINYHHFGAPKVWYCISPNDQAKFERVASFLFPEESKECGDFLRHKDILISPNLLRTNNIGFVQAKQQPGEFIVLNAAAYHGGFNLGFNCAEAVNFATEDWIDIGKSATRCLCKKDNVRISMRLFDPNWNSDSEDEDESEETSFDDSDVEGKNSRPQGSADPLHHHATSSRSKTTGAGQKRPPSRLSRLSKKQRLMLHSGQVSRLHEFLSGLKSSHSSQKPGADSVKTPSGRRPLDSLSPGSTGTRKAAGGSASTSEAGTPYNLLEQRVHGRSASAASTPGPHSALRLPSMSAAGVAQQVERMEQDEVDGQPQAIIAPPSTRDKYFHLVQRLKRPAKREGYTVVRWLKEGDDGLFRPEPVYWEERSQVLANVRTQIVSARDDEGNTLQGAALLQALSSNASSSAGSSTGSRSKNVGGSRSGTRSSGGVGSSSSKSTSIHGHVFKLLTLRSRILEHDLP